MVYDPFQRCVGEDLVPLSETTLIQTSAKTNGGKLVPANAEAAYALLTCQGADSHRGQTT